MKTQEEIEQLGGKYATTHEDVSDKLSKYLVSACFQDGYTKCQENMSDKKYTESQLRDAIRNTITYLATLSETGKFHSGNIVEEAIIQSLNKQD